MSLPLNVGVEISNRSVVRRVAPAGIVGLVLAVAFACAGFVSNVAAATPSCRSTQLSARIVDWQGAAGSRIADVFLVNTSFASCTIRNFPRVQMLDRHAKVLIQGAAASTTGALHTLAPLGFLKTEVSASNYCGGAFAGPVTLAFRLPGTLGGVVAMPRSSADASGVPPCNGAPGSAGHISMHVWHT